MTSVLLAKMFPLQITKRFYFWAIIITLIPTLILIAIIPFFISKLVRTEKEKQLYAVVDRLNFRLPGPYNEIIKQKGAINLSREKQILLLNQELQPIINSLAHSFPDIGMGYYSIQLDSILAINPEIKPFKGLKVSHEIPYFNIYKIRKPQFGERNTSIGWDGGPIIWYAYPVIANGEVTGHVWANIKTETIFSQVIRISAIILCCWLVIVIALLLVSYQIFKKVRNDLVNFSNSVIHQNMFNSEILPELNPLLENIKENLEKNVELASLVESSNDAIIYRDTKGLICYWNNSAERVFGYLSEEVIGQDYSILVPLERREEYIQNIREVLSGEKVNHFETIRLGKNRVPINVSLSVSPIFHPNGEIRGISVTARDITLRKQFEKEMARLERLNIVGQMASGIGHEIRNPMTSVKGFLQLLADKETGKKKEYYDLMIEELDRANSIITEYLSLAKDRFVELQPASLNVIINTLYPLLSADAMKQDKRIELNKGDVPNILLNDKEIRQLVINLVRNAIEASPLMGSITISTFVSDGEVVLSVEDEGTGIPPEIYDKLGTPFVTTKDNGTGLGVSVCYSIAHKHNAKIDVKTGSLGTTFYVRFKMTQPNMEQVS